MEIARNELKSILIASETDFNILKLLELIKYNTNIVYFTDKNQNLTGILTKGEFRKIMSGEIPEQMNRQFSFIDYNNYVSTTDYEAFFANKKFLELPVLRNGKIICELYRTDKQRRKNVCNFKELESSISDNRLLDELGSKIHIKDLTDRTIDIYQLLKEKKEVQVFVSNNTLDGVKPLIYNNEICETILYDTGVKFDFIIKGIRYIDIESVYCSLLSQSVVRYLDKNDVAYVYFEVPKYDKIYNKQKDLIFSGSIDEFANDVIELERVYGSDLNQEYWRSKDYEKVSLIRQNQVLMLNNYAGLYYTVENGIRKTKNSPISYINTIHVYGSCIARGFGVADDSTIESFLQVMLNGKYNNQYRVLNYGIGGKVDDIEDYTKMMFTEYQKGDIIIHIGGDSWNNTKKEILPLYYTCSDALNQLDPSYPCFIDKVTHINHIGNQAIAKYIFEVLNNNHLLNPKYSNGKVPPFKKNQPNINDTGLNSFKEYLKQFRTEDFTSKKIGAIVMNCNPFTNGHLYLIEYSRKQVDYLYVFVVEENKSYFSYEDRYYLVKENCSQMDNVMVLPSGRYIISTETFPDYFMKNELQEVVIDPSHDVELFGKEIAPVLNIKTRFVGTEPFDKVTAQYNSYLKKILGSYGVEFVEIARMSVDETIVSASYVRSKLQNHDYEDLNKYVPPITYQYLLKRFCNQDVQIK